MRVTIGSTRMGEVVHDEVTGATAECEIPDGAIVTTIQNGYVAWYLVKGGEDG